MGVAKGKRGVATAMATRVARLLRLPAYCRPYSSSSPSLPWSEILPYRSVRIDLVSAWREGWRLQQDQDFAAVLRCERPRPVCGSTAVCVCV